MDGKGNGNVEQQGAGGVESDTPTEKNVDGLKPAAKTARQILEEASGDILKIAEAVVKQAEIAKAEKQYPYPRRTDRRFGSSKRAV
jgi:hypothetical protein